jgi:hypothetical protein
MSELSALPRHIANNKDIKMAIIDNSSNALLIYFDGKVELEIATEKSPRNLGTIKEKTLYVERNREKHLHRKSNSYGFNYYLLNNVKVFDSVALLEDGQTYYNIPKEKIIEFGKVMYFKNSQDGNSFEVQIFLSRDIIKLYQKND